MFGFLMQILNMIKAGGNFGFIAQNIASIYYAISITPFGKGLTEEQKLYATGLIDAMVYIQEGSIDKSDIANCIDRSKLGIVGFTPTVFPIKTQENEKNFRLISFSMQLEAYILTTHSTTDYKNIVYAVLNNEQRISNMINKTILQGTKCNIFPMVYVNVLNLIKSEDFRNTILSY